MNKEELYREFLFSTRNEDRGPHDDGMDKFYQMLRTINQHTTERRLKLEKKFGKPRSKYHR